MKSTPSEAGRKNEAARVLVIDDEPFWAETVQEILQRAGFVCDVANSGKAGARKVETGDYDVVLTDLRMPDMDGLTLLRKIKQEPREVEVIVVTGHDDIKTAVAAIQAGAFNYLTKQVQKDELRTQVQRAVESLRRTSQLEQLRRQIDEKFGFEGIIGEGLRMKEVLTRLKAVAPSSASVLIQGETGTGKELVAKALHNNSPRKNRPFVEINCTASNENLLDDLLFGHVPGAYTGADKARKGVFEEANGGTLFLDEIGDMPLNLQAKLLKVLEDQKVYRVGSNEAIPVNVRVLSATHQDLEAAVAARTFRHDLYYRLCVVTIRLPPLRERREDIPLLVDHFIKEFNALEGKAVKTPPAEAVMRVLRDYAWPGNVRELRNLIRGMVVLDVDGELGLDDLQNADAEGRLKLARQQAAGPDTLIGRPLAEIERFYIEKTLERTSGNREEAANLLGIGERTLYRVIRDWKLQDQIKEALDAAAGDVAAAAKSLGLTAAALQRKIKRLGLTVQDDDE